MKRTSVLGRILFGGSVMGAALLPACQEVGESRITLQTDPCQGVVSSEIEDAQDIDATFTCMNRDGQLDFLSPLVAALVTPAEGQSQTLADAWLEWGVPLDPGTPGTPLTRVEVAAELDRFADAIESGATEATAISMSQNIDEGIIDAALRMAHLFGQAMSDEPAESRRAFEGAIAWIMCHGDTEVCDTPLRRYLQGVASERLAHDPADEDFAFPQDDAVRRRAEWMFYADGDVERARKADDGLARALVRAAAPRTTEDGLPRLSLLSEIATQLLPELHGDDPSTPDIYEGYGSRNPRESALFGFMSALSRKDVRQAVVDAKPESFRLISNYFSIDSDTILESYEPAGVCDLGDSAPQVNGFAQLFRLVKAASYDYDDPSRPSQCGFAFKVGMPYLIPYYDFSGSKNLAVITLEMFSQMPVEQAQQGVNILNHSWAIGAVKAMCDLPIDPDDTEAVQAVVYMPENMKYGQPYLRAFANANELEAVVSTLADAWDTGVWCEITETVRLFDDPHSFSMPVRVIDPLLPQEGGGPVAHDRITLQRMNMLVDIGRQGEALFGPIEAALGMPGFANALGDLFYGYGSMAHRPDSAFQYGHLVAVTESRADPEADRITSYAKTLGDSALMDLAWRTLADDRVRAAVLEPGPTGKTLLEEVSARLKRDSLGDDLRNLAEALRNLESRI